jgi:hypothetical protein
MKLISLVVLCAGTTAFCQSAAQPKVDPDTMFRMPDRFSATSNLVKPPAVGEKLRLPLPVPQTILAIPPGRDIHSRIDPRMIQRPPWPRKDLSQGQDVSRNLYPNLRYLPLHIADPAGK